jgi:hypothetical protein
MTMHPMAAMMMKATGLGLCGDCLGAIRRGLGVGRRLFNLAGRSLR